ncbi:MAG: hypothetical protein ABSA83_04450 [Verrucomicrobiota bacterium]
MKRINRPNLFCTMAIGEKYAKAARYLVADLADYDQPILILTDQTKLFDRFKNASVVPYSPAFFSYHDKRLALGEALKLSETAIFVDADCVLRFGLEHGLVQAALNFRFPPGFHVWKVSTIAEAGPYLFPEKEELGRKWNLKFDRDQITYQEMLFGLTKENGSEARFFAIWDKFEAEATARQDAGPGEGICIGLAAQGSGMTCHGAKYMDASMLSKIFWHVTLDYTWRSYHRVKFKMGRLLGLRREPDLIVHAM